MFLSIAALLLSWQQFSVSFAFHSKKEFTYEKSTGSIRVLSWNVSQWTEGRYSMGASGSNSFRIMMMQLIQQQNADVLCLQEFFESYDTKLFQTNVPIMEKMGYPYHYFFPSIKIYNDNFQFGMAIFSKYPIEDTTHIASYTGTRSEGLSFADINVKGQKFRVFDAHLESVGLSTEDYEKTGVPDVSESKLKTIINEYKSRSIQAEMVNGYVHLSPYPSILCCDMDDVPNSYAYFTVKGDLQDVFLKKGFGFGRTFRFISPTLRIDYIFADKRFRVDQFTMLDVPYSDHYPLITDLSFKGN
jgi:endonuclease/exonuclease/phosphatase family metal-dependent hydrolase